MKTLMRSTKKYLLMQLGHFIFKWFRGFRLTLHEKLGKIDSWLMRYHFLYEVEKKNRKK